MRTCRERERERDRDRDRDRETWVCHIQRDKINRGFILIHASGRGGVFGGVRHTHTHTHTHKWFLSVFDTPSFLKSTRNALLLLCCSCCSVSINSQCSAAALLQRINQLAMLCCCSVAAVAAYRSTREAPSPQPPFFKTWGRQGQIFEMCIKKTAAKEMRQPGFSLARRQFWRLTVASNKSACLCVCVCVCVCVCDYCIASFSLL